MTQHKLKSCDHRWAPTDTPPAASSRWYRCSLCSVFGYRRQGSTRGPIQPYRCTHGQGTKAGQCGNDAVAREPGNFARGGYRWKCREHDPARTADPSPAQDSESPCYGRDP